MPKSLNEVSPSLRRNSNMAGTTCTRVSVSPLTPQKLLSCSLLYLRVLACTYAAQAWATDLGYVPIQIFGSPSEQIIPLQHSTKF